MTMAPTSIAALESMQPITPTIREQVFEYIKSQGVHGSTIDQCATALGLRTATVCGRFNELKGGTYGDGTSAHEYPVRIVCEGEVRKTASGRSAQVWVAKGAAVV